MDTPISHQYVQAQEEAVQVWCAICSVNKRPRFQPYNLPQNYKLDVEHRSPCQQPT